MGIFLRQNDLLFIIGIQVLLIMCPQTMNFKMMHVYILLFLLMCISLWVRHMCKEIFRTRFSRTFLFESIVT